MSRTFRRNRWLRLWNKTHRDTGRNRCDCDRCEDDRKLRAQ